MKKLFLGIVLVVLIAYGCCAWYQHTASAPHDVDLTTVQPPFPERVLPREQLASKTAGYLEPFKTAMKDGGSLAPAEVLAALENLAKNNLTFDRHLPGDDPLMAYLYPHAHLRCLVNSIDFVKSASKAFTEAKDAGSLKRLITAQMEVARRFRKAPSCILEASISTDRLDRTALELAIQARVDGLLADEEYHALLTHYSPTRAEYIAALESALNGEVAEADATIALAYMKEFPEDLQKKLGQEDFGVCSDGEQDCSAEMLRRQMHAFGGPEKMLQANHDIAALVVRDFVSGQANDENMKKLMKPFEGTFLLTFHRISYFCAIKMEEVLGLYAATAEKAEASEPPIFTP